MTLRKLLKIYRAIAREQVDWIDGSSVVERDQILIDLLKKIKNKLKKK